MDPAPTTPNSPAGERRWARLRRIPIGRTFSGHRSTTLGAALLVLAGFGLPLWWGLLLPISIWVAAIGYAHFAEREVGRWLYSGHAPALLGLPRPQRIALGLLAGLFAVVTLTVAARGVAAITIVFPATLWTVMVALVWLIAGRFFPGARPRAVWSACGVLALVGAALVGTRFEAGGADARGWAQSGPIWGTHPMQTTAVIIDGYGPFDIPFNDYVEPDGSKGYDPDGFADALERALHEIAEVHFAGGSKRAAWAYGNAEVEAITAAAVRESLDQQVSEDRHPRIVVRSGSFGQNSRVEFVCPGRRDDPKPFAGESVMVRACSDKYASEASAGLGLTGRWFGYAEARGNERLSLARLWGATRSDDAHGRNVVATEARAWAWMILVLLAGAVVLGRARLAMRVVEVGAATTVAAIAVALVLLGFALVGAPAHAGSWSAVGWIERAPAWVELGPWARDDFAAAWNWLPALAILGGLAWFIEPGAPRSAAADETSSTMWRNATAAIVLLVTLAAAAHLGALTWWRPDWAGQGGQPFERFVIEVAQAIPLPPSRIAYVESAVAGVFVVLLLGIGAAALVAVHNLVAGSLAPPAAAAKIARWPALAVLAVVVIAACLVVSRKTAGASTLVPTAMALHALLSTGLTVQACAGIGRRRLAQAVHLAMAIAAVGWAAGVVALAPQGGLFVHLCAGSGVAAALVSIVLVRAARP